MAFRTAVEIERARTHSLQGIDCRVPHGAVTVVTGPSGAGKSSLAFDTIFAEGQRRFVESMSTYARQFLDHMERPPVDDIRNVLPAVALEAKNSVRNARSTMGTITEVCTTCCATRGRCQALIRQFRYAPKPVEGIGRLGNDTYLE